MASRSKPGNHVRRYDSNREEARSRLVEEFRRQGFTTNASELANQHEASVVTIPQNPGFVAAAVVHIMVTNSVPSSHESICDLWWPNVDNRIVQVLSAAGYSPTKQNVTTLLIYRDSVLSRSHMRIVTPTLEPEKATYDDEAYNRENIYDGTNAETSMFD